MLEALCLSEENQKLKKLKEIVIDEHIQKKRDCRILVLVPEELVDPLLKWASSELSMLKPSAMLGSKRMLNV